MVLRMSATTEIARFWKVMERVDPEPHNDSRESSSATRLEQVESGWISVWWRGKHPGGAGPILMRWWRTLWTHFYYSPRHNQTQGFSRKLSSWSWTWW